MSWDVAIIGAGPGGCSAAICARRLGMKVLLIEAGGFPRQKVCGEFVSGESFKLLEGLTGDTFADCPTVSAARMFTEAKSLSLRLARSARSITRWQMDQALWSAAQRSGAVCLDRTSALEIKDGIVRTSQGEFRANAVILAAGRWSRFSHYDMPPGPRWLGIKAHFREEMPAASCDLYFFDGGYCGVQPIGENSINVCSMVRSDRAVTIQDVIASHPGLAQRARDWQQTIETVTTAPLVYRRPTPVQDKMFLIGDAAAFVDPFVGDGISIALQTGKMAAQALSLGALELALRQYEREYQQRVIPALRMAARVRATLNMPDPLRTIALQLFAQTRINEWVFSKTRVRPASAGPV